MNSGGHLMKYPQKTTDRSQESFLERCVGAWPSIFNYDPTEIVVKLGQEFIKE